MSNVDLPQRLTEYGGVVEVQRIALRQRDLDGLPSFDLDTKKQDSRYDWYRSIPGHDGQCWELDAMDPRDLRQRVAQEIRKYIDWEEWERCAVGEQAQQESLKLILNNWARKYA